MIAQLHKSIERWHIKGFTLDKRSSLDRLNINVIYFKKKIIFNFLKLKSYFFTLH